MYSICLPVLALSFEVNFQLKHCVVYFVEYDLLPRNVMISLVDIMKSLFGRAAVPKCTGKIVFKAHNIVQCTFDISNELKAYHWVNRNSIGNPVVFYRCTSTTYATQTCKLLPTRCPSEILYCVHIILPSTLLTIQHHQVWC